MKRARQLATIILVLVSFSCASIAPTIEKICDNARLIAAAAKLLCALKDSTAAMTPGLRARADSLRAQIDSLGQVIARQAIEGK